MNPKFFDVKKEKQDAIINAALMVFAENGYKKASTDNIVKAAGISKGLLFHYFISKQGVYEFIYDYSIKYTMLELNQTINKKETDFFAIQRMIELTKLRVMKNYPYMQQFLNNVKYETHPDALKIINETGSVIDDAYAAIYKRADMSRFNRPVDAEKIIRMIGWMSDGFIRDKFRNGTPEPDSMNGEFAQYLSMLRDHFYVSDASKPDLAIEASDETRDDSVMDSLKSEVSGVTGSAKREQGASFYVADKRTDNRYGAYSTARLMTQELTFEERLALGKKSIYYQEPEVKEEEKPAAEEKPAPKAEPVPEMKPVSEEKPVPEVKPAFEEKPASKVEPVSEEKPIPEVKPVFEEKPAPKAEPVSEEKPAPKAKPVSKEKPAPKEKPVSEEKLIQSVQPEQKPVQEVPSAPDKQADTDKAAVALEQKQTAPAEHKADVEPEAAPTEEIKVEEPAAAETIAEEPAAEEPKIEETIAKEPAAEESIAEEPVVEEPAAEESVAEEPAVEESIAEETVVEEPVAEEPAAEEPAVEESIAEEPVAEEPAAEEPVAEESIAEEPVVEEPVAEEPAVEESIAEEPVVEEPVAEEPAEEEPAAEEPAVEESIAEEPAAEEASEETAEEAVTEEESAAEEPEAEEPEIEEPEIEESAAEETMAEEPTAEEPITKEVVISVETFDKGSAYPGGADQGERYAYAMKASYLTKVDLSFFEYSRLEDFSYGSDERGGRGIPYDSSENIQIFVEDEEEEEENSDDLDFEELSERIMSNTDRESKERERFRELESMGPAPVLPDFNPDNIRTSGGAVDEENEDMHIYRPLSF